MNNTHDDRPTDEVKREAENLHARSSEEVVNRADQVNRAEQPAPLGSTCEGERRWRRHLAGACPR
jgi:hypothetical protein